MHLIKTIENTPETRTEFVQEAARSPLGPCFEKRAAYYADKMEVWGSSFTDEGEDFCEFRLFFGKKFITKRMNGY
jgi:hypothetical protein